MEQRDTVAIMAAILYNSDSLELTQDEAVNSAISICSKTTNALIKNKLGSRNRRMTKDDDT